MQSEGTEETIEDQELESRLHKRFKLINSPDDDFVDPHLRGFFRFTVFLQRRRQVLQG